LRIRGEQLWPLRQAHQEESGARTRWGRVCCQSQYSLSLLETIAHLASPRMRKSQDHMSKSKTSVDSDGDVFVGILAGAIREPLQEYDIRFPGSEQRKRFILRFRLGKWNSALPTHLCSLPCSPAKPQQSTAEQNACGKMTRPRH